MTDIKDVLQRAADVHPPIDVAADLRRGRAFSRRQRVRTTAWATGGTLTLSAVLLGGVAVQRSGSDSTARPYLAPQPRQSHATKSTGPSQQHHTAPHRTIRAATIDPASLTHTHYFLVPPAPPGWHLVGTTINYVMVAQDGTQPPLQGGFQGNLVIGLTAGAASYPTTSGAPLDFDGRVFWNWTDSGNTLIAVRDRNGDWLIAQYPMSAGFELNAMVAFLDAVRPLPGTVTAS
jgi:hypothetical protein